MDQAIIQSFKGGDLGFNRAIDTVAKAILDGSLGSASEVKEKLQLAYIDSANSIAAAIDAIDTEAAVNPILGALDRMASSILGYESGSQMLRQEAAKEKARLLVQERARAQIGDTTLTFDTMQQNTPEQL